MGEATVQRLIQEEIVGSFLSNIFEDFVLLSRQGDLAAWQRRGKQLF